MYDIEFFTPDQYQEELQPLWEEHREELTTNKELMQLKPDMPKYQALHESGQLFSFVLKKNGEVVGYSINFLLHNMHYADVLMMQNDLLFLSKDHRTGRAGLILMETTLELARQLGAHMMVWHAKPDTALDKILKRRNVKVQDIVYTQEL